MGYIGLEASSPPPECDGCGTTLNDALGLSYCEGCAPTFCDWCEEEHPASESSDEFDGHHCKKCVAKFREEDEDRKAAKLWYDEHSKSKEDTIRFLRRWSALTPAEQRAEREKWGKRQGLGSRGREGTLRHEIG